MTAKCWRKRLHGKKKIKIRRERRERRERRVVDMVWLDSKTKVPHVPKEAVERQRLFDLLQYNTPRRLTIVRAPAGYGKTTLLSQWMSQFDEPVVWLSIDATDNDPIRFWKYVIRTVSDVVTDESDSKLDSLFNGQSPLEVLIDSFLNEIDSLQGRVHIVIDDYHLIEKPIIHEMMIRFIDYLPSNTCVYLTSRTELDLPLSRWRVKGWLAEIGVDQLRFTYEELKRFYRKRQLMDENTESLQHVFGMTEGWAAGIQLVGLAGRTSTAGEWDIDSFDSMSPFVTEFLLQEILASLSPTVQDFLVRTSILNQMEPGICDVLTNRTDSHVILLELEKEGLFIVRLDSSQPVFRYHHLFAEALQTELHHRYSQETISLFYKEVATLLREKGNFISAIELVLRGQLYEVADRWITVHLIEVFTLGQTSTFIRWVRTLRANGCTVNIETLVMYIITLANVYEMEEASRLIVELNQRNDVDQWMDDLDYRGIASILETISAFVLLAGGEGIHQSMRIISKQVDKGRSSSKWDYIPMQYNWFEPTLLRTSVGARGRLLWEKDILPLLELFQEADMKEKNITGFALGVAAEISYNRNSLDQALTELEVALQYGHHFKDPGLFIPMYILKGRIYAAKKQFVEAHTILDFAKETTEERHWLDSLRTMKAHCYLLEGHILQAEKELSEATGLNNLNAQSEQEFWLLGYVRFLLNKGQVDEALKTSIWVKEKALRDRQVSTVIEAMVLEAICQMDIGNKKLALESLHEALEQGVPYGYVRPYLDESSARPLLKKYLKVRQTGSKQSWNSVPLHYIERLLKDSQDETTKNTMMDILTPREQDVLQLLVSGASNSEIASQLTLSAGTVRIYLSNIYSKLNVNSRTKAVLWANSLED